MAESKFAQKNATKPAAVSAPKQPTPAPAADSFSLSESPVPTRTSLTPKDVIYLQRTIGNAATVRLLAQQRQSAAPPPASPKPEVQKKAPSIKAAVHEVNSPTHQAADPWIQRFPTKADVLNRSTPASAKKPSGDYGKVIDAVEAYNVVVASNVPTTLAHRKGAVDGNGYDGYLTTILGAAQLYINGHKTDKDRVESVASFQKLLTEVYVEKRALARVVVDASFDVGPNGTWREAINTEIAGLRPRTDPVVNRIIRELGLAASYVEGLTPTERMIIVNTDNALKAKDTATINDRFDELQKALPQTHTLIKSALIRKNIGSVNPGLAAAMNTPDFQQDENRAAKSKDDGYVAPATHAANADKYMGNFQGPDNLKAKKARIETWADEQITGGDKRSKAELIQNFKARQEWEKQNVGPEYGKLRGFEKGGIAQYSQDFKTYNAELRGDVRSKEKDEENGFSEARTTKMQNLISGLNALPPYLGNVFRHDSHFAGFDAINQIGGVTTDMAFLSTTREANTLKKIPGSGDAKVLVVIESKTGRFIKPLSMYNTLAKGAPDENEVLFKPGTKLRVLRRFDRDQLGQFPGIDADLQAILDQDKEKATIEIVLHKAEI